MARSGRKVLKSFKKCSLCGNRIFSQGYTDKDELTKVMEEKSLCYQCAFWGQLIAERPEHLEIIDTECLKIFPCVPGEMKRDKTIRLGGKGKRRYFMRSDLSVFESNDIWRVGTVPERFRSELKPTAIEITKKAFNQLRSNDRKCKSRACFDRYQCFRFDLSLEQDQMGAYNHPPDTWEIGGEHCKYFLDKDKVFVDDNSSI